MTPIAESVIENLEKPSSSCEKLRNWSTEARTLKF